MLSLCWSTFDKAIVNELVCKSNIVVYFNSKILCAITIVCMNNGISW